MDSTYDYELWIMIMFGIMHCDCVYGWELWVCHINIILSRIVYKIRAIVGVLHIIVDMLDITYEISLTFYIGHVNLFGEMKMFIFFFVHDVFHKIGIKL